MPGSGSCDARLACTMHGRRRRRSYAPHRPDPADLSDDLPSLRIVLMLYGLYLSATGVMTNSYRQDVISNNLANAQTNRI